MASGIQVFEFLYGLLTDVPIFEGICTGDQVVMDVIDPQFSRIGWQMGIFVCVSEI